MFQNREESGKLLADKLQKYQKSKSSVVLAIPRGGVLVGKEISKKLSIPLSFIVVKKLGAPGNSELAIGAVCANGVKYVDLELVERLGIEQEYLDKEIKDKSVEIDERIDKLKIRNPKSPPAKAWHWRAGEIRNKKVIILTDDGIATGATTLAAIKYLKEQRTNNKEQNIILAVPVIAKETYDKLKSEVDKIVALEIPDTFNAVGQFYREFPQISDEEVFEILN